MTLNAALILATLVAIFFLAFLVVVERNTRYLVRPPLEDDVIPENDLASENDLAPEDSEWFEELSARHELAKRQLEFVSQAGMAKIIGRR
jgi:hypothetical protein